MRGRWSLWCPQICLYSFPKSSYDFGFRLEIQVKSKPGNEPSALQPEPDKTFWCFWGPFGIHWWRNWLVVFFSNSQAPAPNYDPWLADNQSRDLNNELWLAIYLIRSVPDMNTIWHQGASTKPNNNCEQYNTEGDSSPKSTKHSRGEDI